LSRWSHPPREAGSIARCQQTTLTFGISPIFTKVLPASEYPRPLGGSTPTPTCTGSTCTTNGAPSPRMSIAHQRSSGRVLRRFLLSCPTGYPVRDTIVKNCILFFSITPF
jgi:hypothetical protein